jgi:hypothetical protein
MEENKHGTKKGKIEMNNYFNTEFLKENMMGPNAVTLLEEFSTVLS